MIYQQQISVKTTPRQIHNITELIQKHVIQSNIQIGICHIFIHHTSASLIITENADPAVRRDLEYFMQKNVIDDDPNYLHKDEGFDDMSAHIRTVLTQTEISIPITNGRLGLGTWQGLFCWEHRAFSHQREITITISGELR